MGIGSAGFGLATGLVSSSWLAVLQASLFDDLAFDSFTLFDGDLCPAVAGVGGRHIAQTLVVALAVLVSDARGDRGF